MAAYNHELFIGEAIDGVLMQQTDFDVEIVIGEDCSTDSTRKIILDYSRKYPGKFKLLLPEENLGMIPMFKATYPLCTGKYVAWLDGDDYWTDPLKLQKQVDFLEAHPDFVMCFHNVQVLDQIENRSYEKQQPMRMNPDGSLSLSHFCHNNPVSTSSVVYRNVLPGELPEAFYGLSYPDLAFYFLLAEKGKIQYLKDIWGVYRIHKNGEWSGKSEFSQYHDLWQFYQQLDSFLEGRFRKVINKNSAWYLNGLFDASIAENDHKTARKAFEHIVRHDFRYLQTGDWRKYLKHLFALYF
jgi:glycosyltransferase involved in cell wall biosynthesis